MREIPGSPDDSSFDVDEEMSEGLHILDRKAKCDLLPCPKAYDGDNDTILSYISDDLTDEGILAINTSEDAE